ncbi:MAG: GAF domain-containing protein [Chloroflexi bacterium]|nr:MAG: GAF domain-containing protein [Chloroflexota bacterium]
MLSWLSDLFRIESTDPETQQNGRIVQALILLTVFLLIVRAVSGYLQIWIDEQTLPLSGPRTPLRILVVLFLASISLYRVRKGHPRQGAHLFFSFFSAAIILFLFANIGEDVLPYLLIITVLAIAYADSFRIAAIYLVIIGSGVSTFYYFSDAYNLFDIIAYWIVIGGISLTAWLTNRFREQVLIRLRQISRDLSQKTNLLQHRTQQFQYSVRVSQVASTSLEPTSLFKTIVQSIHEQFGYYHVALFLLDQTNQKLVLREAAGKDAKAKKDQSYELPLDANTLVCWAAQNRTARLITNTNTDSDFNTDLLLPETHSELALPLIARGNLLGVLDIQSQESDTFQSEDITILQLMANQIAINLDNAHLFAEVEHRLNETNQLLELNNLLATTQDVGELYRRAARVFVEQLECARCIIYEITPDSERITMSVTCQANEDDSQEWMLETSDQEIDPNALPLTAKVVETQEAYQEQIDEPPHHYCLEIPLQYRDQLLGTIHLCRQETQEPFSPGDVQLARAMASQTAVTLLNTRLTADAQGRIAQLSTINRITTALSLAPTLKDIFTSARREILSMLEATGMSIVLLDKDGQHLHWVYGYEYGQEVDLSQIPPIPITKGFSGYVVRTREPLLINKHLTELREELQAITVGAPASTWLGLPLIVTNKLIGVLAVENEYDPDAFSPQDVALLKTIAGPIAIAINNLLQFEEIQKALEFQSQQRTRLQAAADIAAATTSILDLDTLINQAVNLIQERFELYYVGLFLIDATTNYAVLRAGTGEAGKVQLAAGHKLKVGGHSLIGGATADGVPRITQDVTQDKEWRPNPYLPDTRSELAIPLRVRGQIVGALTVQSTQPNAFHPELISVLQTMGDQLAVAIENVRLLTDAEARAAQQTTLNQISRQLHQSVNVEEIVRVGLQAIAEQLQITPVELHLGRTVPDSSTQDRNSS